MNTSDILTLSPADFCDRFDACSEGREFAVTKATMAEVWNTCNRVDWLIWIMQRLGQEPDRKRLRLFACWCVRETPLADGRKVWDLLTDERSRNAVVVAERFANGEATDEERDAAWAAAGDAAGDAAWDAAWDAARAAARDAAWAAAWAAARAAARAAAGAAARAFQADHFRTIFANPFTNATA